MTISSFRVWTTPGSDPVWGSVIVLRQTRSATDQYDITVQGDGFDLEQLVRKLPRVFIMFERQVADARGLSFAP